MTDNSNRNTPGSGPDSARSGSMSPGSLLSHTYEIVGLLGEDPDAVRATVRDHARAIQGWLDQGTLDGDDAWRSEERLVSPRFGLKGRADAVRNGAPVELKTGKNTGREPRFPDKIQATWDIGMRDGEAFLEAHGY